MELRDTLEKERGKEPTVSEIAEKAEMPVAEVSQLLCAMLPVLSLTIDDDSENCSEVDVTVGDPTEEIGDSIALKAAVEKLPERDKKIVEFRYFEGLTQTVTADKLGMTQVQVSRLERRVLSRLRAIEQA